MTRRRLIGAGAALAALAAGGGWRLWHERQQAAALDASTGGVWQMRFMQLSGEELVMGKLLGQPLLLNFWGSWCPPCVQEMPDLDRFARQFAPQGWQVVGLAVDNPKAVREFLAKSPVSYTIGLAGFEGAGLTRDLGNSQGGLPYTVAFNRRGEVVQKKAGQTHFEELVAWARTV